MASVSQLSAPSYISPKDLAQVLRSPALVAGKDYLIIDVRQADYAGGHIKGCRNIPIEKFLDDMDHHIDTLHQIPTLYFHCMLSQVRGPKAAQRYYGALLHMQSPSAAHVSKESIRNATGQTIKIIQGGIAHFSKQYPDLMEDFDPDLLYDQ